MVNNREIQQQLASYLTGQESVEDFANWLSSQLSSIRYNDPLFDLAAPVENFLQVYFDGFIDESALKRELRLLAAQPTM